MVIANHQIAGARLDACGDAMIAARRPIDLVGLASALRAGESENAAVVADSDADNVFQTPAYSLALDATSQKALALLRPLFASGAFTSVILSDGGSLSLVGHLPDVARLVFSNPDRGSVASITIRDSKITIGISGQSGFEANYTLARELEAIGSSTHVIVTPDRIQVDMFQKPGTNIDDYAKYGKRELAAIAHSGMWRGRQVLVETEYHQGVAIANGIAMETGPAHPSNSAFIAYWSLLTH